MNRRNFLASLVALPSGMMLAASRSSDIIHYFVPPTMGRRPGYMPLHDPIDLDKIFEQLYRIRQNRDEYIHTLRAV